MSPCVITTFLLPLSMANSISCLPTEVNTTKTTTIANIITILQLAKNKLLQSKNWVQSSMELHELNMAGDSPHSVELALEDCNKLYDETEPRLSRLVSGEMTVSYTVDDALTWLTGVLPNHRSCLEGLADKGLVKAHESHFVAQNLTTTIGEALDLYGKMKAKTSTSGEKTS